MTEWVCKQCEIRCTFFRDIAIYFDPERCVYNERGNDKIAKWELCGLNESPKIFIKTV